MRTLTTFLSLVFVVVTVVEAQEADIIWVEGKSYVGTDKEKFFLPPNDPRFEPYRPKAVVSPHAIVLTNRGIAVTKVEFEQKPFEFNFRWLWTEGREADRYHDTLAVALWTSSKQKQEWSHEIEDGFVVKFMPHQSRIVVHHHKQGEKSPTDIAEVTDLEFKRYIPYHILIRCYGKKLVVIVDSKTVIDETIPAMKKGKIAVYNREPVAGVRHVGILMNPKITFDPPEMSSK